MIECILKHSQAISTLILGVSGIIITIIFSRSATKRENDKMMKELFTEFNSRYDELNDDLIRIADSEINIDTILPEDKSIIFDYFNLCAEEHFWHKRDRIKKKLWINWNAGMNTIYNHKSSIFRDLWAKEMEDENGKISYYIENSDDFFKPKN